MSQIPPATVRWESAAPMLAGRKALLPKEMGGHYVISVNGLSIGGRGGAGGGRRPDGGNRFLQEAPPQQQADNAQRQRQQIDPAQMEHRMKDSTTLQVKGKDPVKAALFVRSENGQIMFFGFPKEALPVAAGDKDLMFTTRMGPMTLKAKFQPKEMMFKGQLAL